MIIKLFIEFRAIELNDFVFGFFGTKLRAFNRTVLFFIVTIALFAGLSKINYV